MKNLDFEKLIAFCVGVGITFLLVITFGCSSPEPEAPPIDLRAYNDSILNLPDSPDTQTTLAIDSEMKVIQEFKK